MNDTIMASLAAFKSRNQKAAPSTYMGFRSVRGKSAHYAEKTNDIKMKADGDADETTIALAIETDILDKLTANSEDPVAEIRSILRDYVRSRL